MIFKNFQKEFSGCLCGRAAILQLQYLFTFEKELLSWFKRRIFEDNIKGTFKYYISALEGGLTENANAADASRGVGVTGPN